jgi:glycosyltransferase involved in cell wall biosynthesis
VSDPDVSVLTPSFGYARFIKDAITSVAEQEGVTTQHVVQDGGSTDGTTEILESMGDRVDWRSEPDRGQSDALNKALKRARGRWVAWLNADEFYLPGALHHLVGTAENRRADLVYGDAVFVDVEGRTQRLLAQHRFDRTTLFHYGTIIPSCALVIRREILGDDPWDETLRLLMDRDLYMGLVAKGAHIEHTKRPIGAFRVHDERVSAADSSSFRSDYATVSARYGVGNKTKNRLGLAKHRVLKVLDGSYARQRKVAALQGRDIRWFMSATQNDAALELLRSCGAA